MKILGLTFQYSGCGFHRVVLPINTMENISGLITDKITDEIKDKKFDILLFNRLCEPYEYKLDEARKNHGCKIVMDLDDDWNLPVNHILQNSYKEIKDKIEYNIKESDLITCTNEALAERIYKLNKNVLIVPNGIPFGFHQFIEDKIEDEKIRLFWCGSITHEHDLNILRNPIKRLHTYRDKIKMILGGYSASNAETKATWDRMLSSFTSGGTLESYILPAMKPAQFMELYEHADICLIPLEKSEWHKAKSNLKVLESSVKSCAVIASNVEPYNLDKDAPILWVNNKKDWFYHLKTLINNPDKIKYYGKELNAWAKKKYNIEQFNQRRIAAYKNLIKS